MSRRAAFVLFLVLGIEFHLSCGTEVSINDTDGKLCLYAKLMATFSVTYEVAGNQSNTTQFELPNDVATNESICGNTTSTLKLQFGEGHSWSVSFSKDGEMYQVDSVMLTYNLSDMTIFHGSISNETVFANVTANITDVSMDTCYACKSRDTFQSEMVNQTLWNVLIQAFVTNGSKSENLTVCAADLSSTTVPPTTYVTNATTSAPPITNSTHATSVPTTPTPTAPPLPIPTTENYSVKHHGNGTACLLVMFGLRIGFKQAEKYQEMNFDPKGAKASGSCGDNSSQLVLTSQAITIMFDFNSDTKKFRLHALNVTVNMSSGVFNDVNSNLSLWEASVGSSYMCKKELNNTITDQFTLYTFDLQVQPFEVNMGEFSTAEECFLDSDLSFLVPIAVGVALSFLIILVLISYLIGRRKSRTGYQSV
ncbi:lysosome-associated membrane glycoprotein 2 isoform X2 [Thalassophryne amazonica]|uniref:lysosome-associated membrane glycoprotein 2 isoform X2 n=1 Tax=Thalassophryne amazonica TaxID=390379 RepID=UPI001471FEE9|nr:lysosome-associated membrane glycoprotein 2 isoform X2 [Thalassophryne amazonica]